MAIESINAVLITAMIIINSQAVKAAAVTAVNNCLNIIIPCIFPVLTMSFFILETGFPVKLLYITDIPLKKLFGLSGNCLEGVLLGLTGGYNTAVISATRLLNEGKITKEEAKRIAIFFTNPGVSFSIILAGATLSGSVFIGIRLFTEGIAVNLIIAYIYNLFNKNDNHISVFVNKASSSEALAGSVRSSSAALISISFNIIFFACITAVLSSMLPVPSLNNLFILTGEISNAVIFCANRYPLYVTSGILFFGGFCIFIQNLSDLTKLGVRPAVMLFYRLTGGFLCFLSEFICSFFFPCTRLVSTAFQVRISQENSTVGSIALIFLSIIYLLSVKDIKQKRIYDK